MCVKATQLYFSQKEAKVPETIYLQKYNKMVLLVGGDTATQTNTFRFLYTPKTKLLSIHYYENVYFGLDCSNYSTINWYVKNYVYNEENKRVKGVNLLLQRNVKKINKIKNRNLHVATRLTMNVLPQYSKSRFIYGGEKEDIIIARKRSIAEDKKFERQIHKSITWKKSSKSSKSNPKKRHRPN